MNQSPPFHADEIELVQLLARRRIPPAGDVAGYTITLRMVSADRVEESDSDPTADDLQMRLTLECLAWETSEMPGENSDPEEMTVEADNPTTRAEVQCVYTVTFTTDRDPNDDDVSTDDANALLSECIAHAYPYIRERMRLASFDVFENPLTLPISYKEIQRLE